jgi:hypothetical protein
MKGGSRHKCDVGVADNFLEKIKGVEVLNKICGKEVRETGVYNNLHGEVYGFWIKFTDDSTFSSLSKEDTVYRGDTKIDFEWEEG